MSPTLGIGAEANDNIYYTSQGKTHDMIYSVAPAISVSSDWSRHAVTAKINTQYNSFASHSEENTFFWDVGVGGRLDIHGHSFASAGYDFSQSFEPRYSPNSLTSSFAKDPAKPIKFDVNQFNSNLHLEGNRLLVTLGADYANFNYFDVRANDGTMIDQDVRDYHWWNWTTRADYAVSPDTSIYLTYVGNDRKYRVSDTHDSHGYMVGIGASFDLTNLVRGDFSVGSLKQTYKNGIYKPITGTAFNANIQYFPTELTTVSFNANTSVQETPDQLASGYLQSGTGLQVDHELLRDLRLFAGTNFTEDKYKGEDRKDSIHGISLGANYLFSRNLNLRAAYQYNKLSSRGSASIRSYEDNVFSVTLGLQY
ncbi:outer membrane beta-barrel protein [Asticcacaulis solisilvae]|uniref:outer membrane beta-barrel protein n=1 Tax=Asticcacaulis solisilvae TaxID=1217274 RepID=UPI003FD72F32